ncbi:hypothetical protein PybrP1_001134 [[Pythium] brassicae (nom. inval.)]|nr:hypothetical protein PybrP1_001134 [[Pythium] brassicae (nom. inval.)]
MDTVAEFLHAACATLRYALKTLVDCATSTLDTMRVTVELAVDGVCGCLASLTSAPVKRAPLPDQAARNQNIFAYLDSDDEDTPKVVKKQEPAPSSTPVALNKPAAGNKKSGKKAAPVVVEGDDKKDRAPRSAPVGGRGGRGGRGGEGRGEGRGERRQFERRSGTGRGRETSKQGGGARNWGNDADKTELVAEAELQDGAKGASDEEAATTEEAAVVEEVEEEEVQFTLDEYLAKKKEQRTGELFAEVEVRQIETDFSGAVQLTKDGKTPDFVEAAYEKVYTKKTSGRKKTFITDVGFQAARPERTPRFEDRGERSEGGGRGGRGSREGGRGDRSEGGRGDRSEGGRGGRDGGRGDRSEGGRGGRGGREGGRGGRGGRGEGGRGGRGPRPSAVPNVTDLSAFPSLG